MQVRRALPSVFCLLEAPSVSVGIQLGVEQPAESLPAPPQLWELRMISCSLSVRANPVPTELPCFCAFAREHGNLRAASCECAASFPFMGRKC